jgi:hypothetical protein
MDREDVHGLNKFANASSSSLISLVERLRAKEFEDTLDVSIARGCNEGATSFELDAFSKESTPWPTTHSQESPSSCESVVGTSISMRRWAGEDFNAEEVGDKLRRFSKSFKELDKRRIREVERQALALVVRLLVGMAVLVLLMFTLISRLDFPDLLPRMRLVAVH